MKYYAKCYDDHLAHHGIIGQKWGVRRYQNSDGSLTDAGRKRYGDDGQKKVSLKGAYYGHKLEKQKKWTEANKKDIKTLNKPEWEKGVVNKKGETILSRDELIKAAEDAVKDSKAKEREYSKKEKEAYDNSKITKQQLDQKIDKALKAGAIVAGTALATYGVYSVYKNKDQISNYAKSSYAKFENSASKGKEYVDNAFRNVKRKAEATYMYVNSEEGRNKIKSTAKSTAKKVAIVYASNLLLSSTDKLSQNVADKVARRGSIPWQAAKNTTQQLINANVVQPAINNVSQKAGITTPKKKK